MAKLAFLISAHKDPVHLKRLIDSLPESSEFFIHIDAKSDMVFHVVPKRPIIVRWPYTIGWQWLCR